MLLAKTRAWTGPLLALACMLAAGCRSSERDGLTASGTIEATEIDVAPLVAGRLVELRVREGDVVARGDTMAVLARAELPGEVEAARARVGVARARLRELEAGTRREEVRAARATLDGAQAELAQAQRELERVRELVSARLATASELEAAEAAAAVAQSRRQVARETLARLETGARPEEIAAARAELAAAEAALAQVRGGASELVLTTPMDGVVLLRNFEAGEVVAAGLPVVTLVDPNELWLRVYIDQRDLARVRVGQRAEIQADAVPGMTFAARVVEISPRAEFTPRAALTEEERAELVFGVKLAIAESGGRLKPGMPARARILPAESG